MSAKILLHLTMDSGEAPGLHRAIACGTGGTIHTLDQGESWIDSNPSLGWAAAYSETADRILVTQASPGSSASNVYYSDDGGESWLTYTGVLPSGGGADSNTWFNMIWTPEERFIASSQGGGSIPTTNNLAYSDDDGATWTGVTYAPDAIGTRARGLACSASRVVCHCSRDSAGGADPFLNRIIYSDDWGETWTASGALFSGLQQGEMGIASNGTGFFGVWARGSTDSPLAFTSINGVAWTSEAIIGTDSTDTISQKGVCYQPTLGIYIAVFGTGKVLSDETLYPSALPNVAWRAVVAVPDSPRVIAIASHGTTSQRSAYSDDGGENWTLVDIEVSTALYGLSLAGAV
jgi:hypothetical protein